MHFGIADHGIEHNREARNTENFKVKKYIYRTILNCKTFEPCIFRVHEPMRSVFFEYLEKDESKKIVKHVPIVKPYPM